ncbi:hypothetical protein BK133_06570 [Paenibacillus sp. FSL H8-0548]|uniref:hypothetical protein n=1 Tax=Paenibacillus sp. FSL H8-0548 TaxID=1920422 RepID=UPI00096E29D5|nr:hypothetical protein [Paenibacillus sp. FSL H8-0548]OMF37261.1 hypothetical protein BK133_06570 [Paenibacillus sp. FSL H8-0548]
MKKTFQVKHAVGGRMFIDTNKQHIPYTLVQHGEGWIFTVDVPWSEAIKELLAHKQELNVFIFQEFDDQPTLKTWYYVKDGPVEYDTEHNRLTIAADSRIEYYPHEYSV